MQRAIRPLRLHTQHNRREKSSTWHTIKDFTIKVMTGLCWVVSFIVGSSRSSMTDWRLFKAQKKICTLRQFFFFFNGIFSKKIFIRLTPDLFPRLYISMLDGWRGEFFFKDTMFIYLTVIEGASSVSALERSEIKLEHLQFGFSSCVFGREGERER